MRRLDRANKSNAYSRSLRGIPAFVLNLVAFTALSLWVAARGACQGISHAMRRV